MNKPIKALAASAGVVALTGMLLFAFSSTANADDSTPSTDISAVDTTAAVTTDSTTASTATDSTDDTSSAAADSTTTDTTASTDPATPAATSPSPAPSPVSTDTSGSSYPDGPSSYPTTSCVKDPTWAYTFSPTTGSGIITATGGTLGEALCTPLSVRPTTYTFDTNALYPQTKKGYNDTIVDKIGAFPYSPPQVATCRQYDVYASFGGFDKLTVPSKLFGVGKPAEPSFLSAVLNNVGPTTYNASSFTGCGTKTVTPLPPKVTPPTCTSTGSIVFPAYQPSGVIIKVDNGVTTFIPASGYVFPAGTVTSYSPSAAPAYTDCNAAPAAKVDVKNSVACGNVLTTVTTTTPFVASSDKTTYVAGTTGAAVTTTKTVTASEITKLGLKQPTGCDSALAFTGADTLTPGTWIGSGLLAAGIIALIAAVVIRRRKMV